MKKTFIALSLALLAFSSPVLGQSNTISLESSKDRPEIDGVLEPGEWSDADSVLIDRLDGWEITVFFKHDGENLYFAFENMTFEEHPALVAEVLFDLDVDDDTTWDSRTLWYHASYSDCRDAGEFYDWETCKKDHPDWKANNLPYTDGNDNIEFSIPIAQLGIEPGEGTRIRLAFNVGDDKDNLSYWPSNAVIGDPSTWGYVVVE